MNFNKLLRDLKNRKFMPLYLLHGEESYYIDRVSDYIEEHVLNPAEKGFNQTIFYGKDTDMMTIINSAKRFPMMSEYQVVLVKEAQDLKWGKEAGDHPKSGDPLLAYLENPLKSTILVFSFRNGKFDKRKKTYKAIDKNGVVFESATIYENKVPAWIEEFVGSKGYTIHPRASALVAEYLGNELSKIANELEKLMLNIPAGREISVDDIQNNIGISKEYNVFELQSAIAVKDVLKANRIINYFAANPKNNPIQLLLGALNNYFSKVLRYHYASDKSAQGLAKELGISPFFVKEYELAGRNYSKQKVFHVFSSLRECDLRSKGVNASGNTEQGDLMKELLFKIIH